MRIDWYTKGVLTVIAVFLGMIAAREYWGPVGVVQAQGAFAGVLPMGDEAFFDSKTGEIYVYSYYGGGGNALRSKWRLTKLGEPVAKDK